jgi:hypothetical protein
MTNGVLAERLESTKQSPRSGHQDAHLPARASIAVVRVLLLDSVVDAVECHPLAGCAEDGTADDRGKGVSRLRVAVGQTSETVGAPRMRRVLCSLGLR